MATPYRPANGDEGDWFITAWCIHCTRNQREDRPCRILGMTMAFDVDDKEYPREMIRDESGPRCTAFKPIEPRDYKPQSPTIRDKRQIDLFAGAPDA